MSSDPETLGFISGRSPYFFLFIIYIVIPAFIYRCGFEFFYTCKDRKLSLHDNTKLFLLPSILILLLWNGLVLSNLQNSLLPKHISILELIKSPFTLNDFNHWYLFILVLNLVLGLLGGVVFRLFENRKKAQPRLGDSFRDRSWEQVFRMFSQSEDILFYVKSTDGELYKGKLKHYSFDKDHALDLLVLEEAIREIHDYTKQPHLVKAVKLDDGLLTLSEKSISNIWFKRVVTMQNLDFTDKEIEEIDEIDVAK